MVFDEHVSSLSHIIKEDSSVIVESSTFPPITESNGWLSPFILPTDIVLEESITNITIPNMLFATNYNIIHTMQRIGVINARQCEVLAQRIT